uniref:T9SS type A sorting domain-containing protein n=1 Tax=candidate division WOR-3 bacterium TaxID=2052148 RepID=A0A7C4XVT7_UNCW3
MKKMMVFFTILITLGLSQEIGAKYLIITNDIFYDAILPYAQWKHKMGLRTKIVRVPSELAQNSTAIRNYIVNAYNNWPIKPDYILFVGAPNYLPWSMTSPYSDNNYTNMDGDIYNEILSGRLTVHDANEAQTVVAKMLRYERYPDLTDSTWFRKGCLIANAYGSYGYPDDDSALYRYDIWYVAGLMNGNSYIRVDTFYALNGYNATSVVNATNNGRGFVLYRGSATNNWYSPFNVNPDVLNNGNKLPIVISATCGTLGTGSNPATAERWFLTGTPATLRGGAGYFATTTSGTGLAYYRSAVARGFFDGVFLYKRRTFGQACEDGRIRVYNNYPNSTGLNEYRGFTTVGDPAMTIWTAKPKLITVSYDTILFAGIEETLQVSVTYQGSPVESAYVCIMFDTLIYQTGWTDGSGVITFTFNAPQPGIMDVTVTGRNLYPFEGTASIVVNSICLTYQDNLIEDSLGNNNGTIDPGETILLWTVIKNVGGVVAHNVRAILRTSDTLIKITDSLSLYENLNPGTSAQGLNPFVFTVSPKTLSHLIHFDLIMMDINDSTWIANFSVMTTGYSGGGNGTGPDPYGYYIYDDTDTLTGRAPNYTWFEIAWPYGPGTIISEITNEDADTVTLPLPFNFKFYGINYNTIGICSNGFVEIGGATYPYSYNDPIPTAGRAKRFAAPYWDDLDPSDNGYGDIYRYYDPNNHLWYVEFYQVALGYVSGALQTFQIVLRDPMYYPTPTGDGEILFYYNNVSNVTSNTVGIEDETETRGIQYLFDGNYDPNAAPLVNGRALLITTKPPISQHSPWINLMDWTIDDSAGGNNNGIPEPDETIKIVIYIKNNGDTLVANLNGVLRESSPSLSLLDSIANFGTIEIGGTGNNSADPYLIQIAHNPVDTFVGIGVYFTGNNGNYETYAYLTLHIHDETGIKENVLSASQVLSLQISPNPFRSATRIKFQIPNKKAVSSQYPVASIKIYDITGRLVKSFNLSTFSSLLATITWDGTDGLGRRLPSGVYFIKLESDEFKTIKKAILLR